MTPIEWLNAYDIEKNEFVDFLDSNMEPMFNHLEFLDTYVQKMLIVMKMKYAFYELLFSQNLTIAHLLDLMHIFIMPSEKDNWGDGN